MIIKKRLYSLFLVIILQEKYLVVVKIGNIITIRTFVTVFHRILDFKTGLDFYPGPFFFELLAASYEPTHLINDI